MKTKRNGEISSSKKKLLEEDGTYNSKPDTVVDTKFQDNDFFDPDDLIQVKYEMLRRVSIDKDTIASVTKEYGVSRPTYYQAKANFVKSGIGGLFPKKRGPQGPNKMNGKILEFIENNIVHGEPIRARKISRAVKKEFDTNIHPRTIERAITKKKRK